MNSLIVFSLAVLVYPLVRLSSFVCNLQRHHVVPVHVRRITLVAELFGETILHGQDWTVLAIAGGLQVFDAC